MKRILFAILALGLCGCQGLQQNTPPSNPGQMATGNWEFILQYNSTNNGHLESNIGSASTPGVYNDLGGDSRLFTLDSTAYFADPVAGGGYDFETATYAFTLTVNSQLQVSGTLARLGGSPIKFTGTATTGGTSMTGTFYDGNAGTGPFTASVAQNLNGSYATSPYAVDESISGNVITESSQYGSGSYNLTPAVGNFAFLVSDVPVGGDGTVVFWNNTGVCAGNQCAVWRDTSTGNLWVLMNNSNTRPSATNEVVGVLYPGK